MSTAREATGIDPNISRQRRCVRIVHAVIYIGWNYVPYRFATWLASCITLAVIRFRFV